MKKYLLFVLIICANNRLMSQDSNSFNYLISNSIQIPNQVSNIPPEYYRESIQNIIFNLDVYNYYNLQDEYNSELKQSLFEKSNDYNDKLNELKRLKTELLKTNFYFKLDNIFGDYNLVKKGFTIDITKFINTYYNTIYSIRFNALKNSSFNSLKNSSSSPFYNTFELEMPCDENIGLEIENNREKISVYFFFKIDGIYRDIYDILKSDNFHLFIVNNETKKIYYNKTFNYEENIEILESDENPIPEKEINNSDFVYNGEIAIQKIESGFDPYHNFSDLWIPCVAIKFKNISNKDIKYLIKVSAIFIDNSDGEQLDTDFYYLSNDNEMFISGATKQIRLSSTTGWYGINEQNVTAKIYIENILIKTVKINNNVFDGEIK